MSGIFGCINGIIAHQLPLMEAAMTPWGPDGGSQWHDANCGLGQRLLFNTPEARHERLPRWVEDTRLAITAEARIDNRDELCDHFAIPHAERPTTPDSELILHAYRKWGEACPDHLLGDWSFAIWQPDERKLFIARDHHGNTSLVYWQTARTSPLPPIPRRSTPSARRAASTNFIWRRCLSPGRPTTDRRPSTWTSGACRRRTP